MLKAVNFPMNTLERLFPRARVEILRALFETDAEIHVRELTRRTRLSLGAVQRELGNLSEAEIVSSRRDGNRQYFRANKEQPIYPELRDIFVKCDRAADVLKNALAKLPGIKIAFVFGSLASRGEKSSSDVDVMIIGNVGLRKLAGVLRPASERLRREINPYAISPESWVKRLREQDTFITRVNGETKIFIKGDEHGLKGLGR